MSSSTVEIIRFVSSKIFLYGYTGVVVTGFISNIINILLFSSKNYRTNPCSLYFLASETSNLLEILVFVIPFVVGLYTGRNGTEVYVWWCKLMNCLSNVFYFFIVMILCLTAIDRYHATSRCVQRRQRSSMKVAKISILISIIVSFLLGIPHLLTWNIDSRFGVPLCIVVSPLYNEYMTYFFTSILCTSLPIILLTFFGILTYRNIKSIRHDNPTHTTVGTSYHLPIAIESKIAGEIHNDRRTEAILNQYQRKRKAIINKHSIDGQFSIILILQILCFTFGNIPITIKFIYTTATANDIKSDMSEAIEGLFTAITYVLCFLPLCSSFYIYYLSSSTYRQNVKKLFCRRRQIQILPATIT